jgi:hypothetical protein
MQGKSTSHDKQHPEMKKRATLTAEENHDWEEFFCWYLNNGWTEEQADESAWNNLQAKYERLKHYDGFKPEGGQHGR